jgi:hypothetical protein
MVVGGAGDQQDRRNARISAAFRPSSPHGAEHQAVAEPDGPNKGSSALSPALPDPSRHLHHSERHHEGQHE